MWKKVFESNLFFVLTVKTPLRNERNYFATSSIHKFRKKPNKVFAFSYFWAMHMANATMASTQFIENWSHPK